ncbi:transforming growth factor beta-1 proprotein-like [Lepus europaeus]|uniref:transforming growth factor beta-1 proprotein-like n=1 Tax=Lepus europaeus TaxID=9983 RepID=UPI002B49A723|nr:transforming growth factor beta-1 proprotein-like [Lepus europaeus]
MSPSPMRLLLLLLLWLSVLMPGLLAAGTPSRNATDMELPKQRIEAVRAPILPKVGQSRTLNKREVLPGSVPGDTLVQYNKTQDQVGRKSAEEKPQPQAVFDIFTKFFHMLMVDSNHEIYKKYKESRHSVYMLFNTSELRQVVPQPVFLSQAELHLQVLKIQKEQQVELYQKYDNSWRYLKSWKLNPIDTNEWLSFEVTRIVRQWLRHGEEIEGFRLSAHCSCDNKNNVLHMNINGISSSRRGNHAAAHRMNRPFLLLVATPLKRALQLFRAQHGCWPRCSNGQT